MSATDQAPPKWQMSNRTPWVIAPVVHGTHPQGHVLSVCIKTSYALDPAAIKAAGKDAVLQPLAKPLHFLGESYANPEDLTSELLHPNECEMWKPAADVLLLATAHQPRGQIANSAVCGFSLGPVRKQLRVLGDRVWQHHLATAEASEAQPFTSMPLRWSRTFGGSGFADNPVGLGNNGEQLPNIESAEQRLTRPGQQPQPVGVGPINRQWRSRAQRSGTFDAAWQRSHPALPADFDWGHFNCAPADQQVVGYLRGDEALQLSGLHPDYQQIYARLPGEKLRCLIEDTRDGEAVVRELPLVCDTAIINVEGGWVSLLWRGITPISNELMAEIRHIYVASEPLDQPRPVEELIADMAVAKVEELPQLVEAKAKMQAEGERIAQTLGRFGVATTAAELLSTEPLSAEELNQWPLNPHGPKDAEVQALYDESAAQKLVAEEQARKSLARHGLDYDALAQQASSSQMPDPSATVEQAISQLEQHLAAQGEQAPAALGELRSGLSSSEYAQALAWLRETVAPLSGAPPAAPDLSIAPEAQGISHGDPYELLGQVSAEAAQLPEAAAYADQLPAVQEIAAERAGRGAPQPDPESLPAGTPPIPAPALAAGAPRPMPQIAVNPPAPSAADEEPLPDLLREALVGAAAARYVAAGAPLAGQILSGCDFSGLKLSGRDMGDALLQKSSLRGCALDGARLSGSCADGACAAEADMSGADLSASSWDGADLQGVKLCAANLDEANFHGADLRGADLRGCSLNMTNFTAAQLAGACFDECQGEMPIFSEINAEGSSWQGCQLDTALFQDSHVANSNFARSVLPGTHFLGADVRSCDFSAADLRKTQFVIGCDASGSNFSGIQGAEANFMWSRLRGCNFTAADLPQSSFMAAEAEGALFIAADLRGAILRDTQLAQGQLDQADCFRANLGRCDLREASLRGVNAYQSDTSGAIIEGAWCEGANFGGTPLAEAAGGADHA